eukprot:c11279_g1_i1.p1 GENE.c11279_g1_i1~~c11279_g1_i1.p1  ORF type:complete len:613 (-),score=161.40 c11279_g1_i1:52-1890(-)
MLHLWVCSALLGSAVPHTIISKDDATTLKLFSSTTSIENSSDNSISLSPNPLTLTAQTLLMGLTFVDVTIPANAVVIAAQLKLYVTQPFDVLRIPLRVALVKSLYPAQLTAQSGDLTSRQLTYAQTEWEFLDSSNSIQTVDVTASLQEIVSQRDWATESSRTLILLLSVNPSSVSQTVNIVSTGDDKPQLTITFASGTPYSTDATTPTWSQETVMGVAVTTDTDIQVPLHPIFGNQIVGVRFPSVPIPRGAVVYNSFIQLRSNSENSDDLALQIKVEQSSNSAEFVPEQPMGLAMRSWTDNKVIWKVPSWTGSQLASEPQQTPDLSALLLSVTSRSDWKSGGPITFAISRAADSGVGIRHLDAKADDAIPYLHVTMCVTNCPSVAPSPTASPSNSSSNKKKSTGNSQTGSVIIGCSVAFGALGLLAIARYKNVKRHAQRTINQPPSYLEEGPSIDEPVIELAKRSPSQLPFPLQPTPIPSLELPPPPKSSQTKRVTFVDPSPVIELTDDSPTLIVTPPTPRTPYTDTNLDYPITQHIPFPIEHDTSLSDSPSDESFDEGGDGDFGGVEMKMSGDESESGCVNGTGTRQFPFCRSLGSESDRSESDSSTNRSQ